MTSPSPSYTTIELSDPSDGELLRNEGGKAFSIIGRSLPFVWSSAQYATLGETVHRLWRPSEAYWGNNISVQAAKAPWLHSKTMRTGAPRINIETTQTKKSLFSYALSLEMRIRNSADAKTERTQIWIHGLWSLHWYICSLRKVMVNVL